MYQKVVSKANAEKSSHSDFVKAKKFVAKIREAKKDPDFKAFIKEFVKYHTSSK